MILERVVFTVRPQDIDAFKAAFLRGRVFIESSPGCLGTEIRQGIENPHSFLLLTRWESVEAHTVHFRQSENFAQWRAIVGHLFSAPPQVEHFSEAF